MHEIEKHICYMHWETEAIVPLKQSWKKRDIKNTKEVEGIVSQISAKYEFLEGTLNSLLD